MDRVLRAKLPNELDEDIVSYLISIVEGMSLQERRSSEALHEVIGPFLQDSALGSDSAILDMCKEISMAFGGSGYKSNGTVALGEEDEAPKLLSAPVKMSAQMEFIKPNSAFPDVCIAASNADIMERQLRAELAASTSSQYAEQDAEHPTAVVMTQRQLRKQRKANSALQRILRAEAEQRARAEAEMAAARMAAIRASRSQGRQANTGVNIERFSIAHPTGCGDLLTDASLVLMPGRRYGLIGKNGAGKTTLLRCLANYKLQGLAHLRILLVDQHVEGDDESALQWVLRADVERTALLADEQRLEHFLHHQNPNEVEKEAEALPADLKGVNLELALQECYERMDLIGVPSSEQRAVALLQGLGFTAETMAKPTNGLSGGWAMRAALAAALFVRPNLLLLDEPTNHVDLEALCWLQQWLVNQFEGILLVVSHDHVFLDDVCTDILEFKSTLVGQSRSELTAYSGDYSTYEVILQEHRINQARLRAVYEKEKEKLQEFIAREGKKYDSPAHQAQRRMKMKQLEKLMEVERVEDEAELVLRLPKPYCCIGEDEVLVSLNNASFAWDTSSEEEDLLLFKGVNLTVRSKDRIAILGKNGCGKTSLLNLLIGDCDPVKGSVRRHLGSRCTMLQQHHYKGEQLEPQLSPLDHLRRLPQSDSSAVGLHEMLTRHEETAHRGYLSSFGICGPRATLPVKYLSGGQRMRVALAVALYHKPDLLILDEPSNHMDSETSAALMAALKAFEGAVIVVSHDEAFVMDVVCGARVGPMEMPGSIYLLAKQALTLFEGSFRDYKKAVLRKLASSSGG